MKRASASILASILLALASIASAQSSQDGVLLLAEPQFASLDQTQALEAELRELRALVEASHVNHADDQILSPAPDRPCVCHPGLFASADLLYWWPRRTGLDFAISDPNTDNDIEGPVQALEMGADSGVRASLGYVTGSQWDFVFTYTFFESNAQRSVTEPAGGRLWLTRTNPASGNNHADSATAAAGLSYDVFDLAAGRWFYPNRSTALRLFGGVRGATIDDQLTVNYQGGTVVGTRVQELHTQLDAIGLRAGGEGHWFLHDRFSLFCRTSASVLAGDYSLRYVENEAAFAGAGDVNISYQFYDVVPVLDVAAGLNLEMGRVALQVGYEAAAWFNFPQRTNFTGADAINRGNLTNTSTDLGLDGLFARVILVH